MGYEVLPSIPSTANIPTAMPVTMRAGAQGRTLGGRSHQLASTGTATEAISPSYRP